jgi:hypothetical protein
MLGQRWLAHPLDRLAQTRHAQAGRERRTEADLLNETERRSLAAYPPMVDAAEVMVAMTL